MFGRFLLVAIFLLCSWPNFLFAQNEKGRAEKKEEEVPPWMERVDRGGGSTYLVPKGAKIEAVAAGFVKVEAPAEYVARMVFEQNKRLEKIEKRQEDIAKELTALKKELQELREQRPIVQSLPEGTEEAPSYGGLKD